MELKEKKNTREESFITARDSVPAALIWTPSNQYQLDSSRNILIYAYLRRKLTVRGLNQNVRSTNGHMKTEMRSNTAVQQQSANTNTFKMTKYKTAIETNVKNPKPVKRRQKHQNVHGSDIKNPKRNGGKTGRSWRSSGQFIGVQSLVDELKR